MGTPDKKKGDMGDDTTGCLYRIGEKPELNSIDIFSFGQWRYPSFSKYKLHPMSPFF